MPAISRPINRAQPLLTASCMRFRLAAVMSACTVVACGQVTFGDLDSSDGGPVDLPDAGVDVGPDVNIVPDTGEPPGDGGCRPVTLPPNVVPASWPFVSDQATFQALFLDWAQAPEQRCSVGLCHGIDNGAATNDTPPLIVGPANLDRYQDSLQEVWALVVDSEFDAFQPGLNGKLWRHSTNSADPENSHIYTVDQALFLMDFIRRGWACQIPAHLATQDAGPSCGDPGVPDAGLQDADTTDTGGADAGAADATGTPPAAELCFCEEQPDAGVDTQYCAP